MFPCSPQGRQEFSLPPIDVIFANLGVQRLVPSASFLKRHGEGLQQSVGD
jgi:hypothetical protein